VSKIKKNKTLLGMFGIDQPEQERMKQLRVSTLANKPKRRIFSGKK